MDKLGKTILDEICGLLETYKGRDKVLRTICYSTKLIGGLSNNPVLARRMQNVSSQMSATRCVLRLLDDLPMLKYTLEYGLGKEENDALMASLGVTTNIIDQLYYPIEKMAWLAEHRLISGRDPQVWDTFSSIFWVASIYLTLMKTVRYVVILQQHKSCMKLASDKNIALRNLIARQRFEILTCMRMSLDFVHAVNTLPSGFLWSSKLKTWHVGLIATTSSIIDKFDNEYAKPEHNVGRCWRHFSKYGGMVSAPVQGTVAHIPVNNKNVGHNGGQTDGETSVLEISVLHIEDTKPSIDTSHGVSVDGIKPISQTKDRLVNRKCPFYFRPNRARRQFLIRLPSGERLHIYKDEAVKLGYIDAPRTDENN